MAKTRIRIRRIRKIGARTCRSCLRWIDVVVVIPIAIGSFCTLLCVREPTACDCICLYRSHCFTLTHFSFVDILQCVWSHLCACCFKIHIDTMNRQNRSRIRLYGCEWVCIVSCWDCEKKARRTHTSPPQLRLEWANERMTDHNNWQRKYSMPHTNSDTLDAQTHVEMRGSQLTTLLTAVCRYLCLLFACRVCPSHAISFSLILVLFALLLLRSVRMRPHIGFCSHVLFTTS